jgi:Ca2+-binding RTX toxin-like protein
MCAGISLLLILASGVRAGATENAGSARVRIGAWMRYLGPRDRGVSLWVVRMKNGAISVRDRSGPVIARVGCRQRSDARVTCVAGAPIVKGTAFVDHIRIGPGFESTVRGRQGGDGLAGGSGADQLFGEFGNDDLSGAPGNDLLLGGGNNDNLEGGLGDDTLSGGPGRDLVFGNGGDDVVYEGGDQGQDDTLSGGDGFDTLDYQESAAVDVSLDGQPNDGVPGANDNVGNSFERLLGSRYGDMFVGDEARNILIGNAGADTLIGAGGHDLLAGGHGNDHIDARDGMSDRVVCGTGPADVADVDAQDSVTPSCETVNVAP